MAGPAPLSSLRSDIDDALDLLTILMENARTDDERSELLAVNRALDAIATQIDNGELTSRNAAIAGLVKQLGSSASDLGAIHQKAVDLQNALNIAQKLLTGFGNIASAVAPKKPAKPPTAAGIAQVAAAVQTQVMAAVATKGSPLAAGPGAKTGTWSQISQPAPFPVSMILLLTDGTVLCQASQLNEWWGLSPDASGRYANGSWRQLANSKNAPTYYASATLADGRVMVAGGEYSSTNRDPDDLCTAEMFDPTAGPTGAWSDLTTPPGWKKIGDAPCCLLPDGTLLLGSIEGLPCAVYDPVHATWNAVGAMKNGTCDEETWTLLPDGSVLAADCFQPPATERYIKGSWRNESDTPVALVESASSEIGPAVLLPSGQVWAVGATGNTAFFTANQDQSKPGKWRAGPVFPKDANGNQLGAKDAPACLLPNGRVLCAVGPVDGMKDHYSAPTTFFELDPTQPNATALTKLPMHPGNDDLAPYVGRLLLLPSSEVMFVNGTPDVWFYQPAGAPNPNWAPTITEVANTLAQGGSYALKGTRLNGMSQACAYGDDAAMATNFPLVYLRSPSSGHLTYCRTSGHSTMAVATGALPASTQFAVPEDLAPGNYHLAVVANGIASGEVTVSVAAARVASIVPGAQPAAVMTQRQIVAAPRAASPQPAGATPLRPTQTTYGAARPGFIATALLLVVFVINVLGAPTRLLEIWLATLVLVALSLAFFGLAGGRWEATFIDNRNRMSLSKLQVILWTVAIFSALLSASCFNAGSQGGVAAIMGIVVDPKLWGLLGISMTMAVGTPLTLSAKRSRVVSSPELSDTQQNLHALTGVPPGDIQNEGHVLIKTNQSDARWSDLIRGDDVGNGDMIDFSKVQQLYFTLLTLLIFGLAVAKEFITSSTTTAVVTQLPVPDAGFLGLLAASGAGYLVYKGISHSKDGP